MILEPLLTQEETHPPADHPDLAAAAAAERGHRLAAADAKGTPVGQVAHTRNQAATA